MARKLESAEGTPSADAVWAALASMANFGEHIDKAWLSLISAWVASRNFVDQAMELVNLVEKEND